MIQCATDILYYTDREGKLMLKGLQVRIKAMLTRKSVREVGYQGRTFQDVMDQKYHVMNPEQRLIVDLANQYCDKGYSFLELGCGAGRNLECLRRNGYNNLYGVDASQEAINVAKQCFPDLAKTAQLRSGYIQDELGDFKHDSCDVIYSIAVLHHILSDTEPIFNDMSRVAKRFIITVENDLYEEGKKPDKTVYDPAERVARDYNAIFSRRGFEQVAVFGCWEIPLKLHDMPTHFSREESDMLEEIRRFATEKRRSPTAGEVDGAFTSSLSAYEKKFGSWLAALEACGIEKPYAGQTYTVRVLRKK